MPGLFAAVGGAAATAVAIVGAAHRDSPWKTVAGTGKSGFGGNTYEGLNHGFAVETRLNTPWGLALDEHRDLLYVADTQNHVIRSVDLTNGLLETIAGTGHAGASGDNGLAVQARLNMPTGLVLDTVRRVLYISDTNNHMVRAIGLRDAIVYQAEDATMPVDGLPRVQSNCLAGGGSSSSNTTPLLLGSKFCSGSTGGGYATYARSIEDFIEFQVSAPYGIGEYELRFRYADRYGAVHASGGRRMRLIVNGRVLSHEVSFRPSGLLPGGQRDVFEWVVARAILATGTNVIRLEVTGHGGPVVDLLYVVPYRSEIWAVAGTGVPGVPNDLDSPENALLSRLHTPLGLAIDEDSRVLYIADADNGRVRRLDLIAGTISTIAGGRVRSSSRDGEIAKDATLLHPTSLALDTAKVYLYIVDSAQHRVRRLDLSTRLQIGGTISTVCGFGMQQAPFELLLRAPQDVVLDDALGLLYVTDRDHGRIRAVNISDGICPNREVSRLECASEGVSRNTCEMLGCCYDANHSDCMTEFNPDGRINSGFSSLDVVTIRDGAAASPPISFVHGRSGRCCYPKLRTMTSWELLDNPQSLVRDPRNGAFYVTQPRKHRVVRLFSGEGRCIVGSMLC